ncbi:hypothetical protein N781_00985 [Pontibacillus halophilus JSM 076056 = DSM 19796]|uniref:Uncharacterized protein n=1 Tax=Pontibacillus halophilus JSM 076056 = DSM 19796 TaxID=1385510 RepID=A0A0A5GRK9_9BACI|nr:SE1561 family protein [Pontibacillus halophilus]KGX93805.1 hypothetical protein N781_00985 [Pontibacillus halophilus JSM 076056 = DSM 19796]
MGKSVQDKASQLRYVQNRVQMLHEVVATYDAESVDVEDLERFLTMMSELEIKINRFKQDWEEGR